MRRIADKAVELLNRIAYGMEEKFSQHSDNRREKENRKNQKDIDAFAGLLELRFDRIGSDNEITDFFELAKFNRRNQKIAVAIFEKSGVKGKIKTICRGKE